MRLFKSLTTALFVVVGVTIHCSSTTPLVKAAGLDSPNQDEDVHNNFNASTQTRCDNETLQAVDSITASEPNRQRQTCPLTLEWRRWSLPYLQEDSNACREFNGNLVCVTPNSANRLHW